MTQIPVCTALATPDFWQNAPEFYREWHASGDNGLHRLPDSEAILVTSYHAIDRLRAHPAAGPGNLGLRMRTLGFAAEVIAIIEQGIVTLHPPQHGPVRAALQSELSPAGLQPLRERLACRLPELVEQFVGSGGGDLLSGLAAPIQHAVWALLLDMPEPEVAALDALMEDVAPLISFEPTAEDLTAGQAAILAACQRLEDHLACGRRRTGDSLLDRVDAKLADIVPAKASRSAATVLTATLFDALHTGKTMLANYLYMLASHPDAARLLRMNPDMGARAWEEGQRYASSLFATSRVLMEDVELFGRVFPKGQSFMMAWTAGNRDPRQFVEPDKFDIERSPGRTLTFGGGVRICVGRPLTKIIGVAAAGELLRATQTLAAPATPPRWSGFAFNHFITEPIVVAA